MRIHGTLTKWNDDRGFGFISQANGSADIFVHISAFPRDNIRPSIGELVSYEKETSAGDKLRAVRIMRAGQNSSPKRSRIHHRSGDVRRQTGLIPAILAIAAFGAYAYFQSPAPPAIRQSLQVATPDATRIMPEAPASTAVFECDGRTRCTQMTSCDEARYFVENCPNTAMDGDSDGEPCEQQWCTQ